MSNPDIVENQIDNEDPDLSVIAPNAAGVLVIEPAKGPYRDPVNPELVENLPDTNISFKIVEDANFHLVSLKEIDEELAKTGTVDYGVAEIVAETYSDFFQVVPKGSFTKIPTKAGYKETKSFVKSAISKEEAQLLDLFNTYVDTPFKSAIELLTRVKETYIPGLIRIIESFKSEIEANKENLFPEDNESIKELTSTNLASFTSLDNYKTSIKDVAKAIDAIAAIQAVIKVKPVFDILNEHSLNNNSVVSIRKLYEFMVNPNVITTLNELTKSIEQELLSVNELVNQSKQVSESPSKITELIVKNTPVFISFGDKVANYCQVVYNLTLLCNATKQLITTYVNFK